jgi:hypothetical protein
MKIMVINLTNFEAQRDRMVQFEVLDYSWSCFFLENLETINFICWFERHIDDLEKKIKEM